jgi:hypothetical protein
LETVSSFLPRPVWTSILLMVPATAGRQEHTSMFNFFCWDGILQTFLPELTWNQNPPGPSLPCSWGDRCMLLHPAIGWDRSCKLFAQAGLELWSSHLQPPKSLGLQAWATDTQLFCFYIGLKCP